MTEEKLGCVTLSPEALEFILKDPILEQKIDQRIAVISAERDVTASTFKEKDRFIRSTWEMLQENEMLTGKAMIDEFYWIVDSSSELPRREREYIRAMVHQGIGDTLKHYQGLIDEEGKVKDSPGKIVKKPRKPKKVKEGSK